MKPQDKRHALWALVALAVAFWVCKAWVTPKRALTISLCTNEVQAEWMR